MKKHKPTYLIKSKKQYLNNFLKAFLFISFFANTEAFGQENAKLQKAIGDFLASPELKNANVSFQLLNEKGISIGSINPEKSLMPASTLKLFTTAAAISILGDTFRYQTSLHYNGNIDKNTLKGNIILKGSGDPTLGSFRKNSAGQSENLLKNFAEAIGKLGVKTIDGNIITDIGNFEINTIPDGWIWTDIGNYYGASAAGLNLNENQYKLYFKPGQEEGDECPLLRIEPEIPYLKFINHMKTGKAGSGDNGYIYGGIFSNEKYLAGTLPAGVKEFSIKGSIPDPAYFSAFMLNEWLIKSGIELKGKIQVTSLANQSSDAKANVVYKVYSPQLSEIVDLTNKESINLYAEALLKTLGSRYKNAGSTAVGLEVIYDWLNKNQLSGEGLYLVDGSGLSPANAINANNMVKLLEYMKNSQAFKESLPVAGVSGTLSNFCKGTKAESKIIAKSGSFKRTIGYSGYIRKSPGVLLPFSIHINNYSGSSGAIRKRIEKLLIELI